MRNLVSDMLVGLNHNRAASVDEFELLSVVADPACMDTRNTEFPSKVILESNHRDTEERVEKDVKPIFLVKLVSFHVGDRTDHFPCDKNSCTDETVADSFQGFDDCVWKLIIGFL